MLNKLNNLNLQRLLKLKNGEELPKPNENSRLGYLVIVILFILLMCLFIIINNNKLRKVQQSLEKTETVNITKTQFAESAPPILPSDQLATDQSITVISKMIGSTQAYRTIEYYKLHKQERKLKLEECAKDLQTSVGYENCKNAKAS